MEFGFIYYEMNKLIQISTAGHMLIDAMREIPYDYEKYQTNNPFRKNANTNVPLPLLLNVIKRLKDDKEENGAGIFRKELPLVICWKDNDSDKLYTMIKKVRKQYKFTYSNEIMYEMCLKILNVNHL